MNYFLPLRLLCEALLTVWGISRLLPRRRPWSIVLLIFAIGFPIINLSDRLFWPLIGVQNVIRIPLGVAGLLLLTCLCFGGRFPRKAFTVFLIYLGMFLSDITTTLVFLQLTGLNPLDLQGSSWYVVAMVFSYYSLCAFYLWILPFFFNKGKRSLAWREQKNFILIPICQVLMLFGLVYCATITQDRRIYLLLGAAVLLTVFSIAFLMRSMDAVVQKVKDEERLRHLDEQQRMQTEYDRIIAGKMEQIRAQRHDIASHLQTMHLLLEGGDYRQTQRYLDELEQQLAKARMPVYCDNVAVNSVLYYKMERAQDQGIELKIKLHLPARPGIAVSDIVSLFSNLMDNAIEGAAGCEGRRWITVSDHLAGQLYTIKVENSKPSAPTAREGERLITSKSDPEQHGYGTQIVRRIAEKYDGEVQFIDEGNRFSSVVLLQFAQEALPPLQNAPQDAIIEANNLPTTEVR